MEAGLSLPMTDGIRIGIEGLALEVHPTASNNRLMLVTRIFLFLQVLHAFEAPRAPGVSESGTEPHSLIAVANHRPSARRALYMRGLQGVVLLHEVSVYEQDMQVRVVRLQ